MINRVESRRHSGVRFEVMFALSRKRDHFLALVNSQRGNQHKTKTLESSSAHFFPHLFFNTQTTVKMLIATWKKKCFAVNYNKDYYRDVFITVCFDVMAANAI